jgi:hypothetical protein
MLLHAMATITGVWEWRIVGGGEDRRHVNTPATAHTKCNGVDAGTSDMTERRGRRMRMCRRVRITEPGV